MSITRVAEQTTSPMSASPHCRQMFLANTDGALVYHELFDGHPGADGETFTRLKSRIEFRIIQEQNRRETKSGAHVTEECEDGLIEE